MNIAFLLRSFLRILSLSLFLFFLVACGGSGGDTASDTTPNSFSFNALTDVESNTEFNSNTVTISGIDAAAAISVTNGAYSIDGGDFSTGTGTVTVGQEVVLQLVSSNNFEVTTTATLTIGGVSADWNVTTRIQDNEPDAFIFDDKNDVQGGEFIESNTVTLAGFDSAAISVINGEYSLNGMDFTSLEGIANEGDTFTLRHESPAVLSTATETTLIVGGVSSVFSSVTQSTNTLPDWNLSDEEGSTFTITSITDGAQLVTYADVDDDGDMDVLSASFNDDTIAWYENDGEAEPNFTMHAITTMADGAISVHAADVDGDGDMDVLSTSFNDDSITWYENDNEPNPGFTEHVISTERDGPRSVSTADVDDDGDMDVLSASFNDDTITWYESDGATVPSFTEHVITTTASRALSVSVADVDGDGDMDVLSASFSDNTIAWYENDGAVDPSFTTHVITTVANGAQSVSTADVDGDGDMDVLSASNEDDTIAWYENDGATDPSFTAHIITSAADSAQSVSTADVDGDGDMDVLSSSFNDNTIAWYENDSTQTPIFIEHVVTAGANGATNVAAGDLNNDGVLEFIYATADVDGGIIGWAKSNQRTFDVFEGVTLVGEETSSDIDGNTLTYGILDTADGALFSVNDTGLIRFINAPNFDTPQDTNFDNEYRLTLTVSDGFSTITRLVLVNVIESP